MKLWPWLLLIVATPVQLHAQETVNNASLSGRASDPSGAVVSGAAIDLRQLSTNVSKHAITGGDGRFRFPYLPVGAYELTVSALGFTSVTRPVILSLGAAFDLPLTLSVGAIEVTAAVDAEAPVLEADRSQLAGTVAEAEVNQLPYLGRNFQDLALLLPGVSPTNTGSNGTFSETSAVAGQGISINSQRNFSNSFLVDGLSANDDASGLVETSFSLDTIREMQVVTSGGQAELGRALGGYLNFVTRSGSDTLHGTGYGFFRNQRLNAANALSGTTLPLTQAQYGASLGGPIRKDHTFFFGNFEQLRLNRDGLITIPAASASAINSRLQSSGYPGPLLNVSPTGVTTYPTPVKSTNFFGKLDFHTGNRDDGSLRYSLFHVSSVNSRYVGGLYDTSAGASLNDLDQTVAAGNIFTLTPRTVNETRAQFTRGSLAAPVNDPVGPAVTIAGVAQFGELSLSPTARYNRLYEVIDNLSHQFGPHALRIGADFLYNNLTLTYPLDIGGIYAFPSLAAFQRGTYTTFTQSFGNPVVPQTNPNLGLFLQDEWRATPSLTVNAGLRYDLQFLRTIATDTNNLAPRLGLAWSPFPDRRTVLRTSAGLFYDRVPLRALSNALQYSGNTAQITANTFATLALAYGQTGAPTFPRLDSGYTALALPANLRIGLSTMDPHLPNAYAAEISAEVEQQLRSNTTLSLSYQHLRGIHLLQLINQNVPACSASLDPINLCRPIVGYANNRQYRATGDSSFDSLSVSLLQRPARWGSYRVSYTWSKALDDVGEALFSSPMNNFSPAQDRSRSDDDQRHRLLVDATLHTPLDSPHRLTRGFLLSGILQYYSRLPFNVLTGTSSLQQTPQRPCAPGIAICTALVPGTVIPRNTGIGFDAFTLNARLARTFALTDHLSLQAAAEAFNALNHRNNQFPNATFGPGPYPASPSPTFAQATAVADPRSIQLALRLTF